MDIPIKMEFILNKNIFAKNIKHLRKDKKLTQTGLCDIIGAKSTSLSNWEVGSSLPELDKLITISNFFGITIDNLLLVPFENWQTGSKIEGKNIEIGIPLIPVDAMAGIAGGDVSVMGYEIKDRYVIPEFDGKGVSFLIKASGGSMYPKYSNGDILACRPVTDLSFFQWGKVYVLDTDQGPLVKRLFECKDDDNCIYCHSDNKDHYPPFKLRKDSIRKIAIVVGVIRLE